MGYIFLRIGIRSETHFLKMPGKYKSYPYLAQLLLTISAVLCLSGCLSTEENISSSSSTTPVPTPIIIPTSTPAPLSITPALAVVVANEVLPLHPYGGHPPYTFEVNNDGNLIPALISDQGLYESTGVLGTSEIIITDSWGDQVTASIKAIAEWEDLVPDDALLSSQWAIDKSELHGMDALKGWKSNTDCSDILVGVLDTGIEINHPDLSSNIWINSNEIPNNGVDDDHNGYVDDIQGWNFYSKNNDPSDDHYHGTHVSGIIGAIGDNKTGVSGVCWKASIVPLKFLDESGYGFTSDAVEAIYYASHQGIKVLNNSWGGGGASQSLTEAMQFASQSGMIIVNAAGNNSQNIDVQPFYPASIAIPTGITVAATQIDGKMASYSNYGSGSIQVAAPGTEILSTVPAKFLSYATLSGTSMAAPQVSGVVAWYWSQHVALSAVEARNLVISAALHDEDLLPYTNGKVINMRNLK